MSHVRTQLRSQSVTELSAIASFGGRVVSTRRTPVRDDQSQLPYCNVYTDTEESTTVTMAGPGSRKVERNLELTVEVYESGAEDTIDDVLDALVVEVENVLGISTLNDLAHDVSLRATVLEYDVGGNVPIGTATMAWAIKYYTTEGDPETAI